MKTRGLSQGALERTSGLARGYVSMILSGKRGNLTEITVNRLAEALGVRQAWLAFGEGAMTEDENDEESTNGQPEQDLADRLKIALDHRKLSHRAASTLAGLGNGYVSRIVNGSRANITEKTAKAIADALQIRLTWLLTGEGPMINDDGDSSGETHENVPKIVGASASNKELDPDSNTYVEPPESLPIYGNLPGWREAEREAKKQLPQLPNWVWHHARNARGVSCPTVDVGFVAATAMFIYKQTPEDIREDLTDKELQKQFEALQKAHATRQAKKSRGV